MPKKLPAVEVYWADSCTNGDGWQSDKDLKAFAKQGPVIVRSVGMLKKSGRKALTLISSTHDNQNLHGLTIPRACVQKIRRLK